VSSDSCCCSGQSPPEAEKNYLDNAKLLAFYGVDLHRNATVCIRVLSILHYFIIDA